MPTTTKYIWDEDNLLAEADGSDTINAVYMNEPQRYGNLVSTRISNTTSYHHFDALGSTRQLTNAVGHVADSMTYDAWGNVVTRTGTTPAFHLWIGEAGYYYDVETGLFSVRERPYEPDNGRWTTVDPLEFVETLNRYLYAQNAPLAHIDPSGLACCKVKDFSVTRDMQCNVYKIGGKQFVLGELFKAAVNFKTAVGDAEKCRCCEYRQYVDGTAMTRFRTAKGVAFVPVPPWVTIGENGEYQEDVSAQGRPYGHRAGFDNSPVDDYEPQRDTGCSYSAIDYPGVDITNVMNALKAGQIVELNMNYHFLVNIVDVCNHNQVIDTKMIDVNCCVFAAFNQNVNNVVVIPSDDPILKRFKPKCGG